MCGIVGAVAPGGLDQATRDSVGRMTRSLAHRGPDGCASYVAPSGRCVLGHTRLKVIDLVTGDQPQGSEDGLIQVVFNGEIYNFRELRDELRALGCEFRTQSDTEVLLHGYRCWGDELPNRLNGMFAVALWDEREATLTLMRDRAGQKPLFVYEKDGSLLFASEMKAILSAGVDDAIDPTTLPLYLSYGYVPSPRTMYGAIRKLPPGSVMQFGADGVSEARYWQIRIQPERISERDAISTVRELTRDAVRRCLVSDVPLGAFLSGGVDSSLVVGLMSEFSQDPVSTFSIGFEDEPNFDETSYANLAARTFGTRHTEFVVAPGEIDLVDRLVEAYDEPFGDSSALPTYLVSRLTREHVTVALTGDGADEVFAGYLRFRGAQMADRIPNALGAVARFVGDRLPHNDDFRSLVRRAARFLGAAGMAEAGRFLHWTPYFGERLETILRPECAASTTPESLRASYHDALARHGGQSALARALAMNFETYLLDDLLVKADRCSMAHGLELRAPFLDTELVDYVGSLPDRLKIRGGTFKYVLKQAFADVLPPAIVNRPKWGFAVPLPSWFRTHWRPLLEERLLASDARINEWIRPEAVRSLATAHFDGSADTSHRLWNLLTLETWLRRDKYSRAA